MSRRGGIAGKALGTMGFQIVGLVSSLVTGIAIARTLGPAGRGTFGYAVIALGLLLTYGQGAAVAVMTQYKRDGVPSALVYRAMLRVLAAASVPLVAATLLYAWFVPGQRSLMAVAAALPFALFIAQATTLLVADGALFAANALNAVSYVGIMPIVLGMLFIVRAPIEAVLGVWVGGYVVGAIATACATHKYLVAPAPSHAGVPAAEQFRFGLKSAAVFFAGYLNLRVDVFIISFLTGPIQLGLYTLAVSSAELLWKWSQALNWASFGRLAGDSAEATALLVAKLTRTILMLQTMVAAVAFVAGPWLITTVYGSRFAGSGPVLRMLLPGIVAYSLEAAFGFYIVVRLKRPLLVLTIQSVSAAACALLTFTLVPRVGLVGAAFATSATYCAVTVFKGYILARHARMDVRSLIVPSLEDFRRPLRSLRGVATRAGAFVVRFAR